MVQAQQLAPVRPPSMGGYPGSRGVKKHDEALRFAAASASAQGSLPALFKEGSLSVLRPTQKPAAMPNAFLEVGPGRYCSPRHRAPFQTGDEGLKRVGSRGVQNPTGPTCHLFQETRVQSALDEVVSIIPQALPGGVPARVGAQARAAGAAGEPAR